MPTSWAAGVVLNGSRVYSLGEWDSPFLALRATDLGTAATYRNTAWTAFEMPEKVLCAFDAVRLPIVHPCICTR